MIDKSIAIVLGGTLPHKVLIEKLKERGYYTVLVDYFETPPAREAADKHLQISTLDQEKVLELAKELNASLVLSPCLDQPIVTACYVAEKLGLPIPFSYETAMNVTNKELMKKIMVENNIPTAKYVHVKTADELKCLDLRLPLMVKPADNCGSAGITKVTDYSDLPTRVQAAVKWSRTDTVVVEEYMQGREVSVYTYIQNGKAHVLLTSERISVIDAHGDDEVIKCFCAITPTVISAKALDAIQTISDNIARAFGLVNTPMFYQSIVDGDDVKVIEFAPRMGGGLSFTTIPRNTDFDILEASIDSYLGNIVDIQYREPDKHYLIHQLYGKEGTFSHITGVEELLSDGVIEDFFYHKHSGALVSEEKSSSSRIAAFLGVAKTIDELPMLAKNVMSKLEVYNTQGDSILVKDLYLRKKDITTQVSISELEYIHDQEVFNETSAL